MADRPIPRAKSPRTPGQAVIVGEAGRGQQLRAGAEAARKPWLLFLHADTALEKGWVEEAEAFMEEMQRRRRRVPLPPRR